MRRIAVLPIVALLALFTGSALAANFADATQVDLMKILPQPPADDSATTRDDLARVLAIQASRTPLMVARAQGDAQGPSIFRLADVMGERFNADKLPKTAALFAKIAADCGALGAPARKAFNRKRPGQLSSDVKPVVAAAGPGYPGGHAIFITVAAKVLTEMVPEKSAVIAVRAEDFDNNRVVGGAHYPGDEAAGRVVGEAVTKVMMANAAFKAEFDAAKAELRAVLGH